MIAALASQRRAAAILVGFAALAGCSRSGGDADRTSEVGASAVTVASRPPVLTLPGETEQAAIDRILGACYVEFNVDVGARQADGSQSLNAPTPEILQEAVQACQQRLVDAGLAGDFAPTDSEIDANYARIAAWRECIEAQGYDLPAMVSLEEFRASEGRSASVFGGVDEVLSLLTPAARNALLTACPQS